MRLAIWEGEGEGKVGGRRKEGEEGEGRGRKEGKEGGSGRREGNIDR